MIPPSIIAPVLAFSVMQPTHAGDLRCPDVTPAMDEAARAGACIDAAGEADATSADAYHRQALRHAAAAYEQASERAAAGWVLAIDELVYVATNHCERTADRDTLRICDDLLTTHTANLERVGGSSDDLRPRRDLVKTRLAAQAPAQPPAATSPADPAPPAADVQPVPRRLWVGLGVSSGLLVASGILGGVSMARYLDKRDDVDAYAEMGPPGTRGMSICKAGLAPEACDDMRAWRASFLTSAVVFTASAAALTAVGVLIGRHRKRHPADTSFHAVPTRGGLFAGVTLRF